jgi:hypothetical protein
MRIDANVVIFLREIFYNIERNELKHLLSCMQHQENMSLVVANEKLKNI